VIPDGHNLLTETGFGRFISPAEAIEHINVFIGLPLILMFLGGGIIILAVSIIIPLIYLFEQNPKNILIGSKLG